jgi:hypothetical protein
MASLWLPTSMSQVLGNGAGELPRINCSDFLLNNHTVEPRLFEPKSLLPGNGILPAETKAPKRLRKTKETIAET